MSPNEQKQPADIQLQIAVLQQELDELTAALPRHSVKPSQLLRIEELEDEIARLQVWLNDRSEQTR